MSWAIVAVAGAGIVSGAMASDAAGDAAGAQVAAADRGAAEQRRQYDEVRRLLSPFVTAAVGGGPTKTAEQIRAELLPQYRLSGPNGVQLVDLSGGTPKRNEALYNANDVYRNAWDAEMAVHGGSFAGWTDVEQDLRKRLGGDFNPQLPNGADVDEAGLNAAVQQRLQQQEQKGALPSYLELIGLNGDAAQAAAIGRIENGPQFGSLARQGEDAILANASATGGLRGGNTQGALADFRSNLLSSLIDKQLSRYGGIVQLGQGSAAGVGTAAMNTGQGISGLMQQAGAAQAGGIVAGSNAITGAIGGVGGLIGARGWQPQTTVPAATGYGGAGVGGGGGFGSGVIYGNQDLGQYF